MLIALALACTSVQAGMDVDCTISRPSSGKGVYALVETIDGTAKAGVDYTAIKQLFYLKAGQTSLDVKIHTAVNPNVSGTLDFSVGLASSSVVWAQVSITEPTLSVGQKVTITQACLATNRPETAVVGDTYTIADLGDGDWNVLTNVGHPGDGYFAMYLPTRCFAP